MCVKVWSSLRHLTTIQQFEELKRLNPISETYIDLLATLISAPFTKNDNIADFIKRQLRFIDYFKQTNYLCSQDLYYYATKSRAAGLPRILVLVTQESSITLVVHVQMQIPKGR